MLRLEHAIDIGPPIEEVFDFITEPLNDPARLSSVLDAHAPDGPIAVSSDVVETMRCPGRWIEVTWRVTEHEPAMRSAAESS